MPRASRAVAVPEVSTLSIRPAPDDYFMGIAYAVRERANCRGYKVGAIVALQGRVASTGYNGTPENMPDGDEEDACARPSGPGGLPGREVPVAHQL